MPTGHPRDIDVIWAEIRKSCQASLLVAGQRTCSGFGPSLIAWRGGDGALPKDGQVITKRGKPRAALLFSGARDQRYPRRGPP